MRKISIATLVMLSAYTSSAEAYNVADAIKSARENNMQLKSKREEFKNAKTAKLEAFTTLMPEVRAGGELHLDHDIDTRGGAERMGNLTVTQPLFEGYKTYHAYDKARNSISAAEFSFLYEKNNIFLNVIKAYEEVIRTREIYEMAVTNHQHLMKYLKAIQERFKLGEATLTDVAQTESHVAQALSDKISVATNVSNAEAVFFHLIGDHPVKQLDPIDPIAIDIPETLDELLDIVLKQNPLIKRMDYNVKVSRNDKQLAYANFSPQVSANAKFEVKHSPIFDNSQKAQGLYIQCTIPIFQRGAEYLKVKQAKIIERKTKWDFEDTINQAKEFTIKAWNEYIKNKAMLDSSKQAIVAYQTALAGITEEAKVGTKTTLDVLEAERNLFQVKIQHKNAYSSYVQCFFVMHQLMGTIDKLPILKS